MITRVVQYDKFNRQIATCEAHYAQCNYFFRNDFGNVFLYSFITKATLMIIWSWGSHVRWFSKYRKIIQVQSLCIIGTITAVLNCNILFIISIMTHVILSQWSRFYFLMINFLEVEPIYNVTSWKSSACLYMSWVKQLHRAKNFAFLSLRKFLNIQDLNITIE